MLTVSLISLGFFGGFTHCVGMCGPFVISQISNRLQKIPIEDFTFIKKTFEISLIPYHLGRSTTYALIGFLLSLISQNLKDELIFEHISTIALSLATLFFINILFDGKPKEFLSKSLKKRKSKQIFGKTELLKNSINQRIANPKGINGYIMGIFLGFLPCGLLYGAFLISASFSNPFLAMIGMFLFGLSNFPALFLSGLGGSLINKIPEFKLILKLFILLNIALLGKVILNSI